MLTATRDLWRLLSGLGLIRIKYLRNDYLHRLNWLDVYLETCLFEIFTAFCVLFLQIVSHILSL